MLSTLYKKILVIGGNASGLAAASQARRENPDAQITVLESGIYISYGACGLPYLLSGQIKDINSIFTYPASFFEEKRNIRILTGHKVTAIDLFAKKVTVQLQANQQVSSAFINRSALAAGAGKANYETILLDYDRLIICSGAKPVFLDVPGVNAPNVFYFRDINDTLSLQNFIDEKKPANACIIGGGSSGLLIAEALAKTGIKTTIIECNHKILNDYEKDVTDFFLKNITGYENKTSPDITSLSGIKIMTGVKAVSFNASHTTGSIYSVNVASCNDTASDKYEIDAGMAIISAGITANTGFLGSGRIDTGEKNAIKVSGMQQSSINSIYAAGDCCLVKNIITSSFEYMPTATNAIKSGRVAGANAAGGHEVFEGSVDTKTDRIFGTEIARTGLDSKKALEYRFNAVRITDTYPSYIRALPGSASIFCSLVIDKSTRKILGAQLVGSEGVSKRIDIFAAAISGGFTVDKTYMLDTSYSPWTSTAPDAVNRICGKAISILKSLKQ
jgi:NADPH-dependent 2,4-dienoyl-CoA reductase/sulfur reductase-like enzyme